MRPPLAQVAGEAALGNQKGSTHGSNSRYSSVVRRSDGQRRPIGRVREKETCVYVLAIQDTIARGERGHDFLAGGAGHKSRLATREHAMKWIAIGRHSPEHRIEAKPRDA